jgi:NitT/TauT family transport system permease protein
MCSPEGSWLSEIAVDDARRLVGQQSRAVPAVWRIGLLAAATWFAAAVVTAVWPDVYDVDYTHLLALIQGILSVILLIMSFAGQSLGWFGRKLRYAGAWLVAIGFVFVVWQALTAKLGLLPRPFFTAPQKVLAAFVDDWPRILLCVYYSLRLLVVGVAIGAMLGFAAGVTIGWSQLAHYWGHPLLRFIGPVPATAWLPAAVFIFPTSFSASAFLIALAAGMPVAVLTWSGVSSVNSSYYDVARVLGGNSRFLIFKVAIPAAMPHVFVGLFMGLSFSFAVLVVAEMLGVKAGLGMGAGLGRLRQYVGGTDRHGDPLLQPDQLAFLGPRPPAGVANRVAAMVAGLAGLSPRLACTALGWLGGIVIATAFAWWAVLFPSVVANTGLTFGQAVPCVVSGSQLCELETALCGAHHLFGITSYSPRLFWCGVALLCAKLLAGCILPQTRR